VVVVGGGFGGLNATRALASADVDVTVVDRTNHHLFQPLLYQVAAGILPPGLIAPALRGVIKKQRNARALLADVYELDLKNKVVRSYAPDGREVDLPTTRWWWRPGRRTRTSARTTSPSSPPA
jgi:NADH dehydrogenase